MKKRVKAAKHKCKQNGSPQYEMYREVLEIFMRYLTNLYQNNITTVGRFLVKKDQGIIQGDPLAPILFAIYLDEMLFEVAIAR
jgi:hypothetical protein